MTSASKALFLPASDEVLNDASLGDLALVPFQPAYISPRADRKPRNWITPSSYQEAMQRLSALPHQLAVASTHKSLVS